MYVRTLYNRKESVRRRIIQKKTKTKEAYSRQKKNLQSSLSGSVSISAYESRERGVLGWECYWGARSLCVYV